jgi:hypothetical protein
LLASPPDSLFSITDQDRTAVELDEAVGLSRQLGDTPCLAQALQRLAVLRLSQGHDDAVVAPAEEALALWLQAGAVEAAVGPRSYLIAVALGRGDIAAVEALVAANRALARTAGMARALLGGALLAAARGDNAQARLLWEESLRKTVAEEGENSPDRLLHLALLAQFLLRQGDIGAAVASCAASLAVQQRVGPSRFLLAVLNVLAQAAERGDLLAVSASVLAAIAVQRRESAAEVLGLQAEHQAAVERVRAALGDAAFAEAWAAGEALSADAAIEFGLEVVAQLQQMLATDTVADRLT